MKKKRKIIWAVTLCLGMSFPAPLQAATQDEMNFHCANDTNEINMLLKSGIGSGCRTANELVAFYGRKLLGKPYVAATLEGTPEKLTINVDELDCTTYVETLYALARTTLNGRYSWRDYAANLEAVRYRSGQMNGYASRLHYISDWVVDNTSRGNLAEVTADIPGSKFEVKTLNFMTTHRDSYPALQDSATYAKLHSYEIGYRNHRFPYVRKAFLGNKEVKEALQEGDFVGLVTKTAGLDVSHMGVIVKDAAGDIYMMDASQKGGKVQTEDVDFMKMLRSNTNNLGIRVFRLK